MTFTNKVTVITGASSGIGWALAQELAKEGCKLGLVARRREKLEELAADLRSRGSVAAWAVADVAEREATVAAIHHVAAELGPVDLLIANAGVGAPTLLDPINTPDVERMIRVNLLGVIYAIEAVLPDMLRRRQGHLAAISSMAAYKGLPAESGYCASKAAVNAYMEGLRLHLRKRGIAVTTICPGFVRTPMIAVNQFKMPWVVEVDDAARRIVRALRRRRKVYNFPWQMSLLMTVARWAPDRWVARVMKPYAENPPLAASGL